MNAVHVRVIRISTGLQKPQIGSRVPCCNSRRLGNYHAVCAVVNLHGLSCKPVSISERIKPGKPAPSRYSARKRELIISGQKLTPSRRYIEVVRPGGKGFRAVVERLRRVELELVYRLHDAEMCIVAPVRVLAMVYEHPRIGVVVLNRVKNRTNGEGRRAAAVHDNPLYCLVVVLLNVLRERGVNTG